jgi:hypothetical protein
MQNGAATVRHGRFDVRRAGGVCRRIDVGGAAALRACILPGANGQLSTCRCIAAGRQQLRPKRRDLNVREAAVAGKARDLDPDQGS